MNRSCVYVGSDQKERGKRGEREGKERKTDELMQQVVYTSFIVCYYYYYYCMQ